MFGANTWRASLGMVIRRPLSLRLDTSSLEDVRAEELIEALQQHGPEEHIACVTPMNRAWQITLESIQARDILLRSGVMLRNRHLELTPIGIPPAFASIKTPYELEDRHMIAELEKHGQVDPICCEANIGLRILKQEQECSNI